MPGDGRAACSQSTEFKAWRPEVKCVRFLIAVTAPDAVRQRRRAGQNRHHRRQECAADDRRGRRRRALPLAGLDRHALPRDAERQLPDLPHGGRPLLQGIRRRADAALDLLHQGRPCHSRHRLGEPARQPGFAWLRAAVARQRRDAVCAGGKGRRAQHHGDADRLLAGRAGAQPAARANTAVARREPAPQPSRNTMPPAIRRADAAAGCRARSRRRCSRKRSRPTTAISIRPTAASNDARYPAPRGTPRSTTRRLSTASSEQYYDQGIRGYAPQTMRRTGYYQPRAYLPSRSGLIRYRIAIGSRCYRESDLRLRDSLLAVPQPPPHRAEHVGIIVGPDPLVLVGLGQRPLLR